jgi:hypothetical protein
MSRPKPLIHEMDYKLKNHRVRFSCELRMDENDRFLEAFGSINKSEFVKKLILNAIKEKENEK